MAAVIPPLLEAAAAALARALGYGATAALAAGALNEATRKRDAADKAKDLPIAQAGTQAKARATTCTKCPPDCGSLVERNWHMSADAQAYQARISGFAPGTEWNFRVTDFDGFRSALCLLLEAKARYDQFFELTGKPKPFFAFTGARKILAQAENQSAVTMMSEPARLQWHFMQPISFAYFSLQFGEMFLPIQCLLTP